jgi:hypothetical protein
MVVLAAFVAAAASTAADTPERRTTAAAPPPAEQIAALKRQVLTLRAQLKALRASAAVLRAANAALSPQGIAATLAQAKAANDRFRTVDAALAAGYAAASPCEASPQGGMGFHYVNQAAIADPAIDPMKPEILVYAPSAGGLELVSAEYFKVDGDQNLATDGDRPKLFGRAFDGPMEGHAPGMPRHYDLHVWLWKRNASGMFAQWNPDVRCG